MDPIPLLLFAFALSTLAPAEAPPSSERLPDAQGSASRSGRGVIEIDPRIWSIHQTRKGDYWFGSNGNGAYRYDGQLVTHYTQADGLVGHQVRDIEEDSEGNVLISTTGGVSKFDGERFTTLEVVEAPSDGSGWVLNPDDVWIVFAPGEYGPCRFDGEKLLHLKLSKSPVEDELRARNPGVTFPPAGVYSVYKDRKGHLWFGTASAGLCRYDGATLSWMYEERLTVTPGGGAFGIRCIYEDSKGDYWICNTRQRFQISPGFVVEDGYSLLTYDQQEGLPNARLDTDENFTYYPSMTEDDAGNLWMACGSDGVWRYDGEDVTRYPISGGAYAITIYRDQGGSLWVGTLEHGVHTLGLAGFEAFRPGEVDK